MTTNLAPAGFPAPGDTTGYRRLLNAIVNGSAPAPAYMTRLRIPRATAWRPGQIQCQATIPSELTWQPGVVFGGYAGCLVDMMAGLATTSVLPDGGGFLTAGMALDFLAPLSPQETGIHAEVRELTATKATVEVVIGQDGTDKVRAVVTQILRVG
jgi:acyl-coenzyme A thioesterase PaaI-like protein